MKIETIKLGLIGIAVYINTRLGTIAPLVYLLVMLNIIDYITGMTAAPYRGEQRTSEQGFRGIAKKISMLVLVVVAMAVDWLLLYASSVAGLAIPFSFLVAVAVTVWLIANEMISILENVADIGVAIPKFLIPLVQWIKSQTEDVANAEIGKIAKGDKEND